MSENFQLSNEFWIAFFTVIGTVFTGFIAFFKFLKSQKENRNIELIKHIEHYESELLKFHTEYVNSKHEYQDCYRYAKYVLIVLERLAFLRKKELISKDVIEYFQFWFDMGVEFLNWIKIMEKMDQKHFPYFYKIKDGLQKGEILYKHDKYFQNFLQQKSTNPEFNPHKIP